MNFKYVYKIIDKDEWALAKDKGVYLGSKKDLEDGYIHFSEEFQITGTLEKFFKGQENLLLLKVNTDKLEQYKNIIINVLFLFSQSLIVTSIRIAGWVG